MSGLRHQHDERGEPGLGLASKLSVAFCLILAGCGAGEAGNEQNISSVKKNISANESMAANDISDARESNSSLDPEYDALTAREERDNELFIRWKNRVRPTPANAFPKIGTCYRSGIKKLAVHHERISNGQEPADQPFETGTRYWEDDWTWEANPIRENGRIAIPFNGYVLYHNGIEQFFGDSWPKKRPPAITRSRIGDKVIMCVTHLPDNCPPGDFRGITYRTRDLRTGEEWEEGDSIHNCGGA